jgi:4-alpha-glucanotransferase
VYELRDEFQFAGMKVLQFAFGHEMPVSPHIPHNFTKNFVVYTGTHDNNTILGWYRHEAINHHHQLNHYTGQQIDETNIHHIMCRMAYASVADIAILPLQDVLGLDENARMNIPASPDNNWLWRLLPGQLKHGNENMLSDLTWLYNRRNSEQ